MAAAAKLLHDMGIIKVVPYNPKFNPIKNFAKFDPSTMSLIQLSLHRSERNLALQQMEMEAKLTLATNDNKSCEKASSAAFEIFKWWGCILQFDVKSWIVKSYKVLSFTDLLSCLASLLYI